jgi:hypothetical protein
MAAGRCPQKWGGAPGRRIASLAQGFGPVPKKMTVAVLGDATAQVWEEARNAGPSNPNAGSGPACGLWDLFSTVAALEAFNGTIAPAGFVESCRGHPATHARRLRR